MQNSIIETKITIAGNAKNRVRLVAGVALAILFTQHAVQGAQCPVALGTASSFAVIAGSTATSTGNTIVNGDLGVWAGSEVTGFAGIAPGGAGTVNGTIYAGHAVAQVAQGDLTTAYNNAAGRTLAPVNLANADLGGMTLTPGLYKSTGTLSLTGNVTLDAQGDPNAVFIFQIASSLNTAAGSQVILSGSARAANVYWQVGTSASLGTTTSFKGTIMADQSISLGTGATLVGRALARIGGVTLDSNTITVTKSDCHYSISPVSRSHMSGVESGNLGIYAGSNCDWNVKSSAPWIRNTTVSTGSGNGRVGYTLVANAGPARTGNISVGGKVFTISQPAGRWQEATINHFNNDGSVDIVWQHGDGRIAIWLMNGTVRQTTMLLNNGQPLAAGWRVVGSADFNQDSKNDLVLQHYNGQMAVRYMNNTTHVGAAFINGGVAVGKGWRIAGVADLNADAKPDLALQHDNGRSAAWFLDGLARSSAEFFNTGLPAGVGARLVGIDDFNNDGQQDLVWQNDSGRIGVWFMSGTTRTSASNVNDGQVFAAGWKLAGTRDFNGDTKPDLLWEHPDGRKRLWVMDGLSWASSVFY